MNTGDRREPIFQDDADRRTLLGTRAEACLRTSWVNGRRCGGAGVSATNNFGWNCSNIKAISSPRITAAANGSNPPRPAPLAFRPWLTRSTSCPLVPDDDRGTDIRHAFLSVLPASSGGGHSAFRSAVATSTAEFA